MTTEKKSVSRRSVIAAGIILAAELSASGNAVKTLTTKEKGQDVYNIADPIELGSISVTFLSTEHSEESWNINRVKILEQIEAHDLIIPEYFPPEYRSIEESGAFGQILKEYYKGPNAMFQNIAEYSFAKNKNILVVDPAYNMDFVNLRAKLLAGAISAGLLTLGSGFVIANKILKDIPSSKMSRRKFFAQLGLNASLILGITSAGGMGGSVIDLENDLRRVFVAEKLLKLAESDTKANALVVYPGTHIEKIRYYMEHDDEREQKYISYSQMAEKLDLRSFTAFRSFEVVNDDWKSTIFDFN